MLPDDPIRLKPQEWRSGEHLWVVEAVGERRVIGALLKRLQDKDWKGRAVKLRVSGPDGKAAIRSLEAAAPAAGSPLKR